MGKGALFALGYNEAPGVLGPDTVDGNIVANQPKSLYLGNSTVHGNVVSNGGGTADRFYNFPIKDNVIGGNVIIHGWTGGWWGVIANTIRGNVELSNNASVVHPADDAACNESGTFPNGCDAAPGKDDDSSEVQSRGSENPQHVSGNLICRRNTPPAQVNPVDGGAPNIVDGKKIGECAGLDSTRALPGRRLKRLEQERDPDGEARRGGPPRRPWPASARRSQPFARAGDRRGRPLVPLDLQAG